MMMHGQQLEFYFYLLNVDELQMAFNGLLNVDDGKRQNGELQMKNGWLYYMSDKQNKTFRWN